MTYEEALEILGGPIEPSKGEEKNGWDTRTLTIYMAARERAKRDNILNPPPKRPDRTEMKFRWP